LPDCLPATWFESGYLQTTTAFMQREPRAVDGRHKRSLRRQAMTKIKRLSHHRGNNDIKQRMEALL
jgi:hypothetical protein